MIKQNKLLILLILSIVQCNDQTDLKTDDFNQYIYSNKSNLEVIEETKINLPIHSPFQITKSHNSSRVVIDGQTWELVLLDETDKKIEKKGGFGEGPGEFNLINSFHLSSEGQLTLLDQRLSRLTLFELSSKGLELRETRNLPGLDEFRFEDIFTYSGTTYAVLAPVDYRYSGDHRFYLYQLDSDLKPERQLLKFEGKQLIKSGNDRYAQHPLPFTNHWDVDGEHFYFAKSENLSVHTFNLESHAQDKVVFSDQIKRKNSATFKDYYEDRMGSFIEANSPEWEDVIDTEYLPLTQDMSVSDGKVLFTTFYGGSEHGMGLVGDLESNQLYYINTIPHFMIYDLTGSTIHGVNFDNVGQQEAMKLRLSIDEIN